MKKTGFTLAEILITLSIVGVVAALTIPAIVKSSGQAKVGPSLSKFVNNFETSVQEYMVESGLPMFDATLEEMELLRRYMYMTPIDEDYTYTDAAQSRTYNFKSDNANVNDILSAMANDHGGAGAYTASDIQKRLNTRGSQIFQLNEQ